MTVSDSLFWDTEPEIVTGPGPLTLAAIGFTAGLAMFYRTTALAL